MDQILYNDITIVTEGKTMNQLESKEPVHVEPARCPQCWGQIETPTPCEIMRRVGGGGIKTEKIIFCSKRCGSHYQMGCEG
jgi:uncharacterized protein with PIN domain